MNVRTGARNAAPIGIDVRAVHKRFGAVAALQGVSLSVAPGSVVVLLGPSGCGKTTLLRTLAGLERPDAGEIVVGGRVVAGASTFVAPERRRIGMVFQDWALFPHLSVAGNVGYGLPRSQRRGRRVEEALAMVGLAGMGDRSPATLSGGQQQRVALARAIAPEPGVLLLDEPFSNLDATLLAKVRSELHHLLVDLGITSVFVTHDQEEAFVLGDQVAVMRAGRVEQQASPAELYLHPVNEWVATFVGEANLVAGEGTGASARTWLGEVPLEQPATGPVTALLRPENVAVEPDGAATVELVEYFGHDTVYVLRGPDGAELRARVASQPKVRRGDRVTARYIGGPTVAYRGGVTERGADDPAEVEASARVG